MYFKFYPYLIAIICMVCSSCEQCYNDLNHINYEKLATALCQNDVAQAKALIQQGAPLYDRCYGSLWHAISEAPARMKDPGHLISKETIDFVDSLHLDVNHEDKNGATALFRYHCTKEILERLLQRGADINHRRDDDHTALTSLYDKFFLSYDCGHRDKIDDEEWAKYCKRLDLLIEHGADINILVKGKTMLEHLQEPLDPFFAMKGYIPERYRASRQRIIDYLSSRSADAEKFKAK